MKLKTGAACSACVQVPGYSMMSMVFLGGSMMFSSAGDVHDGKVDFSCPRRFHAGIS